METLPLWINSFGLVLDILGAGLLFKFGLPNLKAVEAAELVAAKGVVGDALGITRKEPEREAEASKLLGRYQRGGRVGIGLLIAGFSLQLLSNAMQRHWLGLPWW